MIALSELDYQRFGQVTAKVEVGPEDEVDGLLANCVEQGVQLLIARCSARDLAKVQEMERLGFFLADTLVYYRKKKIQRSLQLRDGFSVRAARPGDAREVEALAARSFKGYFGHYHADPRLGREQCDQVYSSWAANSCRGGEFCSHVILITSNPKGDIAAFATLKRHEDSEFEGVLFGVDPAYQGKGLYSHLLDLSQQWGIENGFTRMVVSTQVTNVTVQKAWCRQGFEPYRSSYTLHKWFD
jgi:ribosomal protein S18 acetylase RimI-like enzyme